MAASPRHPDRYHYRDPLDLPPMSEAGLGHGAACGVLREDEGATRLFTRAAPEFHDDPDGAGLFAGFAEQVIAYSPAFLTVQSGARIAGYRMSLARDGGFCSDETIEAGARAAYLDRLAQADAFLNEETGLFRAAADGAFSFRAGGRARSTLAGSVVVLCAGEPYNFGSFLFRVLPKLHAVRRYGLGHLPVLVHAHMPTQRQHLALCGLADRQIRLHDTRRIYTIERAIRPSARNPQAFIDDESRALFADLRARYGGSLDGTRIYVSRLGHSRRGASSRVMVNEEALVARLRDLGFLIIEPEALSAREQIEVFSRAEMVVGPSGAGMFNTVFCAPGTRVIDIESEPHWIHAHSCLFASCGLRYGIFEGKADAADMRPVHRRWQVNIEALCARIAAFGAGRAAPARLQVAAAPPREGTLDKVTTELAAGWARDPSRAVAAEIEILVDGVPAGRVLADQKRSDLAGRGDCAFVFYFPPGRRPGGSNPRVRARFADTGADLVHSPRTIE